MALCGPPGWSPGGTEELCQGIRLPGAERWGIRETLRVGGQVALLF